MNKNIDNDYYTKFDEVSLMEVNEFFTKNLFRNLVDKYNILTLGDLFRQTDNGNLYMMIKKNISSISNREDLYMVISGTVNLLKGKYLNEDLFLSENSTLEELSVKLGISRWDILKLKDGGIVDLSQLIELVETNNFSVLYNRPQWLKSKIEVLINKIRLVYEFYYPEKVNCDDYSQFNNIPLTEVQDFFTGTVFKYLINKFGVSNLGDLFTKDANGELNKLICEERTMRQFERENLCNVIKGTVNLLKCKYLNKKLFLHENTPVTDLYTILGISFWDVQKLASKRITTFGKLLGMAETNDFCELYSASLLKENVDIIINKVRLIYEFHYNKKDTSSRLTGDKQKELSILKNELQELYNQLKKFLDEKHQIDVNIALVEIEIKKMMKKKLTLERQ